MRAKPTFILMKTKIAIASGLLLLCAEMLPAQAPPVQSVSIFKNGSAFVMRSGQVACESNIFTWSEGLPEPAFGTLWFVSPEARLKSVASGTREFKTEQEIGSLVDQLAANKKLRIKVIARPYPDAKETVEYTGVLEQVREQIAIIHTDNAWVTLPLNQILRAEFLDKPVWTTTRTENRNVYRVEFNTPGTSQNLDVMYLTRNLGWLPTYLLELKPDDKAEITLSTSVFNNAEDMINTQINFVVGIPNFLHENVNSPMWSRASFIDFLGQLNAPRYAGIGLGNLHNNVQTLNFYSNSFEGNEIPPAPPAGGDFVDAEGSSGEDLFFYTVKNASLRKGEHGIFELLRANITCKHLFEAQLEANQATYAYYAQYNNETSRNTSSWHSVELENNTTFPWTTGAVMVTSDDQSGNGPKPVSQDKLNYTPAKGKTTIKLTSVPDIAVTDNEVELSRSEAKKTVNRVKYDLITIEGKVTVKNYKTKAVDLTVRRQITGMPGKTNVEWKKEARFKEYKNELNERWDVCWEMNLKPGEERTITYQYEVYIGN